MSSTSDDLRPTEGARFLLERSSPDKVGKTASYRATIHTPDGDHAYTLALDDDGGASLTAAGGSAGAALEERLLDLARSAARAASRRRAEGILPWPDRIQKWRGPGRGD